MKSPNLQLHMLSQLAVKRPQWFVHQENVRLNDHSPRQGHSLLLTTRQLLDCSTSVAAQLNHV
jgi:hypothetical protein